MMTSTKLQYERNANMKIRLISFTFFTLLIFSFCSCTSQNNTNDPTASSVVTDEAVTIDVSALQKENDALKKELSSFSQIYEDSLKNSINAYCEHYLSYSGTALNNIDKLKPYLTDNYYNELITKTGHAQNTNTDYQQSTAIDAIYYSDNSSPRDIVEVLALCYQSVINNSTVETLNSTYIFNMQYTAGKWLINSVEKPE